ncbi:hypothetical protein HanPSC8_Chr11g0485881 [Helianthus annuus]|nr:hypothetical protein HanPSC8_Chr11g0485881 [Helianthus annuus]
MTTLCTSFHLVHYYLNEKFVEKKFYNSIKYGNIVIISNNQFQVKKTASVLYACKYVILNKSCNLRHTMLP